MKLYTHGEYERLRNWLSIWLGKCHSLVTFSVLKMPQVCEYCLLSLEKSMHGMCD